MSTKPDFGALSLKLASGKSFETACEEAGIEVAAAKVHFQARLEEVSYYHVALNEISIILIQKAAKKLQAVSDEGPRYAGESETIHNTDVDAAKSLASLGLNIRKLLMQESKARVLKTSSDALGNSLTHGVSGFMRDLFDLQGGTEGNWRLLNPHDIG